MQCNVSNVFVISAMQNYLHRFSSARDSSFESAQAVSSSSESDVGGSSLSVASFAADNDPSPLSSEPTRTEVLNELLVDIGVELIKARDMKEDAFNRLENGSLSRFDAYSLHWQLEQRYRTIYFLLQRLLADTCSKDTLLEIVEILKTTTHS